MPGTSQDTESQLLTMGVTPQTLMHEERVSMTHAGEYDSEAKAGSLPVSRSGNREALPEQKKNDDEVLEKTSNSAD